MSADTKAVLLADAAMFLVALLLGVWKYNQIATTKDHISHIYVDIAHRAALLYSFALLLIATFVQLSGFGELVNLLAAGDRRMAGPGRRIPRQADLLSGGPRRNTPSALDLSGESGSR